MYGTHNGLILLFCNIPNNFSSAAIATISLQRDYIRVTPLTTDTTPLNYNTIFSDRTINKSLYSTFINTEETLNGTRNLTKQDN